MEETKDGDHYDPAEKTVRLTPDKLNGHSLTAVTVAAHEVGHALQDASGFAPLKLRTQLVKLTQPVEKLGAGILMAAPLLGDPDTRPIVSVVMVVGGLIEPWCHHAGAYADLANRTGRQFYTRHAIAGEG